MRLRRVVLFAAVLLPTACAGLLGIEDRFVDADGSTPDAPPNDSPVVDVHADADAAGPDAEAGCPSGMVQIPAPSPFCIDATEVTQRAYASFLAGDAGPQIAACVWNADYKASPSCKPFTFDNNSNLPMVCVDWCDAYAYCAWAGKRLCGAVGGGGVDAATKPAQENTNADQWYFACTKGSDGKHTYPYGSEYDGSACNTRDIEAGILLEAGSLPGCVGGYDGIYDMSGNAAEWEDDCRPSSDPDASKDNCFIRGGAYTYGSDFFAFLLRCDGINTIAERQGTAIDLGFRCCSDLK
jgi:formylglycine-generating enzyme required for sulfatase activity